MPTTRATDGPGAAQQLHRAEDHQGDQGGPLGQEAPLGAVVDAQRPPSPGRLCEPLMELVLLVVTTLDLKNGAADWKHGLAALYIGYTVAYGHYTVKWLDGHAAYRLAGGDNPAGPGWGKVRAVHAWKLWLRTVVAAAAALGLLQTAIWYVGGAGGVSSLKAWQFGALRAVGIHALIAATCTLWPKKAAAGAEERPALATTER
ncbi:hypothetical protein [Streptomyces sp. ISL-94]|uniref:hypothetical protein n=1 Tax=Streptomyces sp. ISL-94 TaxID=2819190 RepID=UPI001BE87F27|nr:hypothetical protein [Streptomyces sp. ISL-94]MBT2480890.1 hypothetical protein [Streptomyces sp. ISL-94]